MLLSLSVVLNIFHVSWAFVILSFPKLPRNIRYQLSVAWLIIYYFILYFIFIIHLCYFHLLVLSFITSRFFCWLFVLFQINTYFKSPMSSDILWKRGNDRGKTFKILATPLHWLMWQLFRKKQINNFFTQLVHLLKHT